MRLNRVRLGHVADAIEGHLHKGRRRRRRPSFLGGPLRRSVRASRASRQGVALAQRVQDLPAHAPRGVCPERSAAVPPVTTSRLHQPNDAPGDEILAVRSAASRIDGPRGDRPRELQVRDDAVISDRNSRLGHAHLPCGADRSQDLDRCQ